MGLSLGECLAQLQLRSIVALPLGNVVDYLMHIHRGGSWICSDAPPPLRTAVWRGNKFFGWVRVNVTDPRSSSRQCLVQVLALFVVPSFRAPRCCRSGRCEFLAQTHGWQCITLRGIALKREPQSINLHHCGVAMKLGVLAESC